MPVFPLHARLPHGSFTPLDHSRLSEVANIVLSLGNWRVFSAHTLSEFQPAEESSSKPSSLRQGRMFNMRRSVNCAHRRDVTLCIHLRTHGEGSCAATLDAVLSVCVCVFTHWLEYRALFWQDVCCLRERMSCSSLPLNLQQPPPCISYLCRLEWAFARIRLCT